MSLASSQLSKKDFFFLLKKWRAKPVRLTSSAKEMRHEILFFRIQRGIRGHAEGLAGESTEVSRQQRGSPTRGRLLGSNST